MKDGWIVIPGWEKFQHYKDRSPVWIKLYTELADKPEWLGLTAHQRGVLVSLWIAYARSDCQLRASTASLSRQLAVRVSSVQLEALNHAGFIRVRASKPLAQRQRKRKKSPKPPFHQQAEQQLLETLRPKLRAMP